MNQNGNVPLIGGAKPRVGASLAAMPLSLGADGQFEAAQVAIGPNGQPMAQVGRASFVDATQLVEMIRRVVREELDRYIER